MDETYVEGEEVLSSNRMRESEDLSRSYLSTGQTAPASLTSGRRVSTARREYQKLP